MTSSVLVACTVIVFIVSSVKGVVVVVTVAILGLVVVVSMKESVSTSL